jgi:GTP-binding protein
VPFADPPDSGRDAGSLSESPSSVNRTVETGGSDALPLVAIIGRVNVGKSTLFNRLVGERRALVQDRPGVTRDRVAATIWVGAREVLLVDTGGLDPAAEQGIPQAVHAQARRAIEDATVILFIVDAREGLVPLDREIAKLLRRAEQTVVLVANKADGPKQDLAATEFHALGFADVLPVSAEHNRGMGDLEPAIAARIPEPAALPRKSDEEGLVRVAIVGRPNVGKSSLVNRLAGEERAIVSEQPGTTRDPTDFRLEVAKRPVVLIDTAGLRRPGRRDDPLERGSAWMALRSIERADVVVLLLDAVEGVTDQDARIARLALDRGRPLLLALNKWDALDPSRRDATERSLDRRLHFIPERVVRRISARTGNGVDAVLPRSLEILDRASPEISTSEINRALGEALQQNEPPMRGRRRLRVYYGTQVSRRPFTVLAFVNDPALIPENYRRYLHSFFRRRFNIQAAPVRIRFRARKDAEKD